MAKEIIINADKEQTRIAIMEDGELAELYIENPENERTIGNIFLGRIRRIMPSIQAAFVDIGQKQDTFLHFSDLSDNLPEWMDYLSAEKPEVGKAKIQHGNPRATSKRRRPNNRRGPKKAEAAPQEEQIPQEGEAGEEGDKPHHGMQNVRTRSQRRSTQRRGKQKTRNEKQNAPPAAVEVKERGSGEKSYQPPFTFLKRDQKILVKISKEPISSKGSRVTTDISLAGRFLVLVPLADYVAVSKKIYSYKERRRLRTLAKSLMPDGFGVIVRTVAEGKNAKALDTDLRLLAEKWHKIEQKLAGHPQAPMEVHVDVNMASSVIRDLFSDDYDRILVDEPRLFRNIKSYIQAIAPHMVPAVQMHNSKQPVFQAANIHKDVAEAFESRVNLPSGGYLFVEQTEAMHVVDVNSGRAGQGLSQEQNSLRVNLEAARIIARQIRLRDLGGIIVVDFIDMRDERNRKKLYDELKREFRRDRAVTKLLPMSDFGLIQITRQRLRPSITTTFAAPDGTEPPKSVALKGKAADMPAHDTLKQTTADEPAQDMENGSANDRGRQRGGRNRATSLAPRIGPEALVAKIEEWIVTFKEEEQRRSLVLRVHPFTAAYLNRKMPNYPTRWLMKHLVRVRIELDEEINPMVFRFHDAQDGKPLSRKKYRDNKPKKDALKPAQTA